MPNKLSAKIVQRESDNWSVTKALPAPCSKANILLIPSDPAQGTYLADILRSEGYAVDISLGLPTPTGSIAAAALVVGFSSWPHRQIERIYEMCLAIRNVYPRIPLLVVGPNDVDLKIRFFKLEADDYLGEPVNATELIVRISSLIRRLGSCS